MNYTISDRPHLQEIGAPYADGAGRNLDGVHALSGRPRTSSTSSEPKSGALPRSAAVSFDLAGVEPSAMAIKLVPERLARRLHIVPIGVNNRTLTCAATASFDLAAQQDVAFASGRNVESILATKDDIAAALDRAYPKGDGSGAREPEPRRPERRG
jgi:hypothetical protein